ncbi:hypothetical protein CGRA01v4_10454 [Colletotrichum graminicola]|nr:hypothetical protein CGRA01v4_10454 [Colletotrichum graminicola]
MAKCYYTHPSTRFHHEYIISKNRMGNMRELGTGAGGQAVWDCEVRHGWPQAKRGTNPCGFELAR